MKLPSLQRNHWQSLAIQATLMVCAWISMCATNLQASEQLLVFDGEITVQGRSPSFPVRDGLPSNWTSPVDYTKGILYIEWEILEAPEDAADLQLQIGWRLPAQDQRHLVRFRYMRQIGPDYETPYMVNGATYRTAHRLQNDRCFWPLEAKDYSQGISGLTSMVRDRSWSVTAPSQPVRIHLTMTVVPKGHEYQPPGRYLDISAHDLPNLPQVGQAMQNRQPGKALALAESLKDSYDADSPMGEQARKAVSALRQWGDEETARAHMQFSQDPVIGAERLIALSQDFADSSLGSDLAEQVRALRQDPRLRAELPAHRIYLDMQKAAKALRKAAGTADFSDPEVQQRHQRQLQPLANAYRTLQQRHRDSVSRDKAETLLRSLGVLAD